MLFAFLIGFFTNNCYARFMDNWSDHSKRMQSSHLEKAGILLTNMPSLQACSYDRLVTYK